MHRAGQPVGAFERFPDFAQRFLQQEARDARAGVDRGEDEQRLEHDGEVIPVLHHGIDVHRPAGQAIAWPE